MFPDPVVLAVDVGEGFASGLIDLENRDDWNGQIEWLLTRLAEMKRS